MRAARWLGVCALGLSLSLTAAARPARSRGLDDPVGLTTRAADIPVLAALLAQAQWEPTPELSGVFRAGSIYEVTATGHRPLATGCFAATPTISTYTSTELVTSLQAGVSVRAGLGSGEASGSFVKKVRFATPTQQSLSTIDLELSEDCLGRLRRQRPETLAGAYVVQEVLVAQISEQTCGRVDSAGRFVGFGAAEAEYAAACAMESLEPVAVGYRTVPLSRLMDGALPSLAPPAVAAPGRPPAPRRERLVRRGGATFCLEGGGALADCFEVHSKDGFAGLAVLDQALRVIGCEEQEQIISLMMDWRRHRTNTLACAFSFYGAPFAGIPGGKARRDLEAVSRAWQRCVAPSGGLSPGSAAPAPGGLSL